MVTSIASAPSDALNTLPCPSHETQCDWQNDDGVQRVMVIETSHAEKANNDSGRVMTRNNKRDM